MRDFSGSVAVSFMVAIAVVWVALAPGPGLASPQFTPASTPPPILPIDPSDRVRGPDDQPYVSRELLVRQQKRLREEHQKQVMSDAARLVQLATALKQQVQTGDQVTLDAIKNVDEIGKLAKRVSERIKTQ